MITVLPRPISFDAPPTPQAAAVGVYAPDAEAASRRPQPVEPIEPGTRVRREQPVAVRRVALEMDPDAERGADTDVAFATASHDAITIRRGPFGWVGLDSTPFMAQLAGQDAAPRDPVAAGRSQTSFRRSPVDLHEEVQGWGRRVELMFVFDGLITAAAA